MGREQAQAVQPPKPQTATPRRARIIGWGAVAAVLLLVGLLAWNTTNTQSAPPVVLPMTPGPTPPVTPGGVHPSGAAAAPPVSPPSPVAVTAAGWTDLLADIDPSTDAVNGPWQRVDDGLACTAASSARLAIRRTVPREYDLRVEFTRRSGIHSVAVMFVAGTGTATFELDCWGSHLAGIQNVAGLSTRDGERGRGENVTLVNDKRYAALVEVRRENVTGYLDGRRIVQLQTDGSDLSLWNDWRLPGLTLGVGAYNSATTFHKIEMREIK
jgi:class 3 adenylate cyclase